MPVSVKGCLLGPIVATVADACGDATAIYARNTGTAITLIQHILIQHILRVESTV
jgi:hypothetical protein